MIIFLEKIGFEIVSLMLVLERERDETIFLCNDILQFFTFMFVLRATTFITMQTSIFLILFMFLIRFHIHFIQVYYQ